MVLNRYDSIYELSIFRYYMCIKLRLNQSSFRVNNLDNNKMWLKNISLFRYSFSTIKPYDSIMLFASYPVGYPMLKKLHSYYQDLSVVTHFTDPSQRLKNQVEAYCKNHQIPLFIPVKKGETKQQRENDWKQFVQTIKQRDRKYKIGIACAYGYMIPQNVINLFQKGMILAHPSLIPKYRGGSPIFHVIANGQKQSGVSFMQISANKFDQGNLLHQVKREIGEKDSYEHVEKQLSELMASQVIGVIQQIDKLRPGKSQSQMDVSGIPPHQLEAKIYKQKNLNVNMRAQQVYNWSRALVNPRVKFNQNQIIVSFDKIFLEDSQGTFQPGQIMLKGKSLYMKCSDKFLKVIGWQQIGKKPLAIHTFINRFIDKQKYKNDFFFK